MKHTHSTSLCGKRASSFVRQWRAGLAACLATLLALPASAGIDIPNDPLTTGSRIAPNILFILDDSSSMGLRHMYVNDISRISGGGVNSTPQGSNSGNPNTDSSNINHLYDLTYVTNTLYYNPSTTYHPWTQADGTRRSGGTSYTNAYEDEYRVSGSRDLSSTARYFYVPKDISATDAAYLSDARNYYRYQITAGGTDVLRAELGTVVVSGRQDVQIEGASPTGTLTSNTRVERRLVSVPAGVTLDIRIENTTGGNQTRSLNYWVYPPSGGTVCNGSLLRGGNVTCSVSSTSNGQYRIEVQRVNNGNTSYRLSAERYTSNSCDGPGSGQGWINCTPARPDTPNGPRTVEAEKINFATWYSYHRTRMKAAKAGASEAFSPLDGKVRVGFRTINNTSTFDIPVSDGNDGRFVDAEGDVTTTSRSTWYQRLFDATPGSSVRYTPLRGALASAGEYFSRADALGPYGPQATSAQYSCRQNFSILTTDGYWNDDQYNPRFDGLPSAQRNADNVDGTTITGPGGRSYTYDASADENARFRDGYQNTLADVAMYYWKRDLRDLDNNVPSSEGNPAFWQHMVTFGISIGLSGNKGWRAVSEVPNNPNWANPTDTEDADRIDDLLHAAVNSRGAFVSASNPSQFTAGLSDALEEIARRTSSASNVAANSVSLDTGSQVFNASYVSGIWTGDLTASGVAVNGVSTPPIWSASIPDWDERKVFTFSSTGGTTFPTDDQSESLARSGGPANYEVTGEENANYLKGEQRLEANQNGMLRIRTRLLGDIIGSSPAYVPGTATTRAAVYVGANDGMMHAFDAGTGQELFAYVPGIVNIGALATLSRGDYSHRYFVDGPITVSNRSVTSNKNILVGSLGRGGKGLYALDVTNPAGFTADHVKWELAETPEQNMGFVLSKPIIAKVQGQTNAAVVLGNGVNSRADKAVLIVVDSETGSVIREIDTEAGSGDTPNALFAPTGVLGPDGSTLAYVYAGDMLGNVWKFDLSDPESDEWSAQKLFTAEDDEGNAQPISAGLAVAVHPVTNRRWIFFGTGRYLTMDDANSANFATQSMYGFMDEDEAVSRDDLTARTIAVTEATASGYPVRAFQAREALPADSKGWYVDLPEDGERIVQDAQVVSTFLVTASMIPTGDVCNADGIGYINALDAFTGTSALGSYFDLDGDPDTNDTVEDDTGESVLPVGSVDAGVGMPTLPYLMRGRFVTGGSGGSGLGGTQTLSPRWDRASWREIRGD